MYVIRGSQLSFIGGRGAASFKETWILYKGYTYISQLTHTYEMKGGSFFMAKNWFQEMRKWMTEKMDLPEDVMMDLPRITMIGQIHIYIENHRGLLTFADDEVRLLLKQGQLLIKGEQFVIKIILPEEILLQGKVVEVIYLDE